MIRRVTVRNFKGFEEQTFDLSDTVVLVGPNNSGKSTLLQAIATWRFGLDRWMEHTAEIKNDLRTGVPVQRGEFTPVPLREMDLLWNRRIVTSTSDGSPREIGIVVEGDGQGGPWSCGIELRYANTELVHIRPLGTDDLEQDELTAFPRPEARDLGVVHLPALFGVARDEPRYERGMQDLLASSGRPGDILRNLLLDIADDPQEWASLTQRIRDLFGIDLHAPRFHAARPYILCEFSESGRASERLDIAGAGSGTLQVILLFAFLHARPASVLLLDEPDAHQHRLLQRQVFQSVREIVSRRNGQVIAATHSEVLLATADLSEVIGFFGAGPRALVTPQERQRLESSLGFLDAPDLRGARKRGAILYVENRSDEEILREWARVLGHRAMEFFGRPNVLLLRGRRLDLARRHFTLLRTEFPELKGVCLLDSNNRQRSDAGADQAGFRVLQWKRYEIENYLLHPTAIKRFVERADSADPREIDAEFRRQVPEGTDLFGDALALTSAKASDALLVPLLERAGRRTKKTDLYQLAAVMKPEEIHPEVVEKLDRIADELLPAAAS